MKVKELRDLTSDELSRKLSDLKEELFNLRFQLATGQLENPVRVQEVRKNIARVMTIIHERALKVREA